MEKLEKIAETAKKAAVLTAIAAAAPIAYQLKKIYERERTKAEYSKLAYRTDIDVMDGHYLFV